MQRADRHHFDADTSLTSPSAIEQGLREGRRLRAQYVRGLFGKFRHIAHQRS